MLCSFRELSWRHPQQQGSSLCPSPWRKAVAGTFYFCYVYNMGRLQFVSIAYHSLLISYFFFCCQSAWIQINFSPDLIKEYNIHRLICILLIQSPPKIVGTENFFVSAAQNSAIFQPPLCIVVKIHTYFGGDLNLNFWY